jgi:dTDP-glucose 4,6-dehydratase
VRLLVTGGAGFIGSNFVRYALDRWPEARVTVLDKLTYAGNLENLRAVRDNPRFRITQGDICDVEAVRGAMAGCTDVVNFAAETHVDRSILDPDAFMRTNVLGTRTLLEVARGVGVERFLQVSTDEAYGDIEPPHRATEDDPLRPRSPYAASKAAGDLMAGAYFVTYGLPTLVTRGANTYGPHQYPEKLLPLFITNALDGLPLPLYGDGMQMRDWLAVEDHCSGIALVLERGTPGRTYNLAAGSEQPNLEMVHAILDRLGADRALIRRVPDRPGHDVRYALSADRASALGWGPAVPLHEGLARTVDWYRANRDWWEPIKRSAPFQTYYDAQYARRLAESRP